MLEKYINGKISRKDLETRMLNESLKSEYDKIENIIFQRKADPTKFQDSINKTKAEISEAKKEEEEA
jgi:penicillin-binding protein 2